MPQAIAYVMSRFPQLSETFILREMNTLEQMGWKVQLFPLMIQHQPVIHDEAHPWLARAQQIGWLSPAVATAQGQLLLQQPQRLLGGWIQTVQGYLFKPRELLRAVAMLPKAARMAQLMRREQIAHIHAHYATYPALVAWMIQRLTGISYSVTVHAHDIYVSQAMLARKLRAAAFVVAISEYNKRFLRRHAGQAVAAKTHVIHCGIQPELYASSRLNTRERWEIVSTGSLQEYKGFTYLIEACALLRKQNMNFRCRIIGGGELREQLQQQINAAQLQDHVLLSGPQTEAQVRSVLATADCYVQPSIITTSGKMEGIPVALMEALASQLPVIASNISGLPELVRDRSTGVLVPPADPQALATAIKTLQDDPLTSQRLAQAGRELVQREFDLQTNVALLAQLLTTVAPLAAPD